MRKSGLVITGISLGVILTLAFLWTGFARHAQAQLENGTPLGTPTFDEGGGQSNLSSDAVDENLSGATINSPQSPGILPTPIPGETLVYFVPTDNDASATVLYLYNTDTVAHIVAMRGFSYNGVLVYSLNINVNATSMLRLASDSVVSAPPPSWATPAPIITNFTDFTYFASLSLPPGVEVEGYTLFNPGTGVENPRQDQGAIPLVFSPDPASLFTPTPTVTQTPTPTATQQATSTATQTLIPTATQKAIPTATPEPTPVKLYLPNVRKSP
jgi:hypothetical protein